MDVNEIIKFYIHPNNHVKPQYPDIDPFGFKTHDVSMKHAFSKDVVKIYSLDVTNDLQDKDTDLFDDDHVDHQTSWDIIFISIILSII